MSKPVALITGVGPGTGAAMARQFSEAGYRVAMLARDVARLKSLAEEIPDSHAFVCDVLDLVQVGAAINACRNELGDPEVFVHNAVGGAFGTFQEIDPNTLLHNFQTNTMALLHVAQRLAPTMVAAGKGNIVVTGNTSALRGKANFAGFAPSKAAQRILAESMARELGPKAVHVSYIIIDAVIDVPWTREHFSGKPDDFFIRPEDIAGQVLNIVQQPRTAWSFNVELRPFCESW